MTLACAFVLLMPVGSRTDTLELIAVPLAFPLTVCGIAMRGSLGARIPVDYFLGVRTIWFTFGYIAAAYIAAIAVVLPFQLIFLQIGVDFLSVLTAACILNAGLSVGLAVGSMISFLKPTTSVLVAASFPAAIVLLLLVTGSATAAGDPSPLVLLGGAIVAIAVCILAERLYWLTRKGL
jgi:hypothetical protein